jgi:D-alanyl-D-alanine carboxypeptidase
VTKFLFILPVLLAGFAAPATQAGTPADINLVSETAILVDADTGQILYEKDMHKPMRPASTTKIMTGLLALERGTLTDTLTMTEEAVSTIGAGAANIALAADEQLTLEQAIHALALVSAADASNGIAEYVSGTVDGFISLMNERAAAAGALHTSFQNAHGMPNEEHLTTAYDLARITMAAIHTPGFSAIFSTLEYEMPPTNIWAEPRLLKNRNLMLGGEFRYEGAIAAKTGWTESSQYCLMTAAKRNGRTLIGIVMKSPDINDKYKDMTLLLDHGFNDFIDVSFTAAELSQEAFAMAGDTTAKLTVTEDFSCLIPSPLTKEDVRVSYLPEEGGELPVKAVFSLDSPPYAGELGELPVTAVRNVPLPVLASAPGLPEPSGAGAKTAEVETGEDNKWHPLLMWIAGIIVAVIGLCIVLAGVIVTLRWINIWKYRRRISKR